MAKKSIFGKITMDTDVSLSLTVCSCTYYLYHWLLRELPIEEEVEFEIADFNQFIAQARPRGAYSESWVRKSLLELDEIGIIKIVKKFNPRCFKLIVFEADIEENKIIRLKK
jgi:hypothetical protein